MTDYYSHPALSHSRLKVIEKSPSHFKYNLDAPSMASDALKLGSLVHAMVLEPHTVEGAFVRCEKIDRRTKAGKERWAELQESDQTVIPADMWDTAESMSGAVMTCPAARDMVDEAIAMNSVEVEFFWDDNKYGCQRKAKIDGLIERSIIDLKTTTDATRGFSKSVMKYFYHTQGAYYRDAIRSHGGKQEDFRIIAVEQTPPYAVAIVRFDYAVLDWAKEKVDQWLETYRSCLSANSWPGFTGMTNFEIPSWAKESDD